MAIPVMAGRVMGSRPSSQQRMVSSPRKPLKDDPDLLFRRILLARPAPNIPHNLLSVLFGSHGFLSHLRSLRSLR